MQISATPPNATAQNSTPEPADALAASPTPVPAPAPAPVKDAPAVTVTLSPEARAAQNALAAMSMQDAVKTLTPGAQSGPLARIKSLLLKLADGSGAAKTEQVQAYVDLHKLVLLDPDQAWFKSSSPEDRKAYAAIMDGGAISNEINKAANDFNHWSMAQEMRSNVPRKNLAHLNALSPLEQQMVFAGTVGWDLDSLDAWKAQMQVDIVNVDQMLALDAAEKKGGKASAKTTGAKDVPASNDDSPEGRALSALTAPDRGVSVAATALKMLQRAAEARAEAKDQADKDRKAAEADAAPRAVLAPYVIGDKVDRSV